MKNCSKCGAEMNDNENFCPACGSQEGTQDQTNATPVQQPVVENSKLPLNVFGLVGMITGILAIILVWISTWLGIALAVVGIVFSSLGMAKRKNYNSPGFAIAGLVCSIVALVVVIIALVIVMIALAAIA